jgi:hypothetical protein
MTEDEIQAEVDAARRRRGSADRFGIIAAG